MLVNAFTTYLCSGICTAAELGTKRFSILLDVHCYPVFKVLINHITFFNICFFNIHLLKRVNVFNLLFKIFYELLIARKVFFSKFIYLSFTLSRNPERRQQYPILVPSFVPLMGVPEIHEQFYGTFFFNYSKIGK